MLSLFAILACGEDVPTFSKDIAPILFKNCVACHRPGEVAPFTLLSYLDVKKRAKTISYAVTNHIMPPWSPEPGYGDFEDARRLTDAEIAKIKRWAEEGTPEGNPQDMPQAPKFAEGWQLGEPDLVVKMPQPYTVRAEGRDVFRCFVIPMDLAEDKYVSCVEYRPSNRRVVHHALFFLDTSGRARQLDGKGGEPGYAAMGGIGFIPSGGLGGWAPGGLPRPLPDGYARPMKKGSDIVLQMHFHPTGKPEVEQSSLGIHFAKKGPHKVSIGLPLGYFKIDIAPGQKDFKATNSMTLPVDVDVTGVTPHAHYLCREMKAQYTLPDGTNHWLIWIKDWDFNWQGQYQYKAPIHLPKGSKIEFEYSYDNSTDNPRNPSNPPKRARLGEQTTDEMAFLFVQAAPSKESDLLALLISSFTGRGRRR